MPLISITAHEANARIRKGVSSWPSKTEDQKGRLVPIAEPTFDPSFRIAPADLVFTIGSCFARNIEKQMIVEGCRVAITQFEIPLEQLDSNTADTAILNRFVPFTMLNELRWALDPEYPFPEDAFIQLKGDSWMDPHAGVGVAPGPLERVKFRRDAIQKYMALAGQSDVIVLTLGLAEGWFDAKTGHYMNLAPFRTARDREPHRFQFHQLEYNEITACLDEMHAVLSRFGRPGFRMLVTVSPIPMATSFTGSDALVANAYSKAVQRAALEYFVRKHDNVDYFPSYESVTLSDRGRAWRDDLAHASDEIVRINVLRMLSAYLENPSGLGDKADAATEAYGLIEQAKAAFEAKDFAAAVQASKAAAALAPDDAMIRLENGKQLLSLKHFDGAVEELQASTQLGSGPYGGYRFLARALRRAGRLQEGYEALAKAREFEPNRPSVLLQSAAAAEKLGLLPEALQHMEWFLKSPDIEPPRREQALADYLRIGEAAGRSEQAQAFVRTLQAA